MTDNIPLIVISGPTAVGKTALSIELAKHFDGEIINGDSMQIFISLDIGTGKISTEEMQGVPHHLLSFLDVEASYDASQFKEDAHRCIVDIYSRGKLPILVGGTGLYLEGLLYDLEFGGENSHSKEVRAKLYQRLDAIGEKALWDELHGIDPQAAAKIPYQNAQRTIRALEVMELTGKLFSEQSSHQNQESSYAELVLVLDRPRSELYDRINARVDQMLNGGLEQEVKTLYDRVAGQRVASSKGIGYKEWWPYFEGSIGLNEVAEAIKQNSRRYAKRQLTWFRNRLKETQWIENQDEADALATAKFIISQHLLTIKEGKLNDRS